MDRPGEIALLLIRPLEVVTKEEDLLKPEVNEIIHLTIIDTNEFKCIDGHCSRCSGKERKIYKVKTPGQNPPYTFICPEGHDVIYHFVNDEI